MLWALTGGKKKELSLRLAEQTLPVFLWFPPFLELQE